LIRLREAELDADARSLINQALDEGVN
jgi:hypothetical protein